MAFREQLTITTAPSGAGKTYVRCARFLVNEFLLYEKGVSWSNYPVNVDTIADHFVEKDNLSDQAAEEKREEINQRIRIIPAEELKDWQHGLSGPWQYFADLDLTGAHISIDEAHLYFITEAKNTNVPQWQEWIGAIRHAGATVELVTQTPAKIPVKIQQEAGAEITLIDTQGARDPYFKILLADWYELKAKLFGSYVSYFVEVRKKRYGKKWKVEQTIAHRRDPKFFAFYNSFNQIGQVQGSEAQKHEYEKRGWLSLIKWFYVRNFMTITLRCSAAFLVCALLFMLPMFPQSVIKKMSAHHRETMQKRQDERDRKAGKIPKVIESVYVAPDPNQIHKRVEQVDVNTRAEVEELKRVHQQISRDYLRLQAQHNSLLNRIIEVRSQNDEIGMLFETWAVTRGGRVIRPGDKIQTIDGEKEIKGFDYESSKVNYSDDTSGWVTIGQRRLSNTLPNEGVQTNGEAYQGAASRSPGGSRPGGQRETRIDHMQSNRPTTVVSPVDRSQANESNDRGIPGAATKVGDTRHHQAADRKGDHGTQSVLEHRTSQARRSILSGNTPQ